MASKYRMIMKKAIFITSFILLSFNLTYSQIKTEEISGVYQWCSVHCEVVKINEDFTVEYMYYRYLDAERLLYKGILKGNWKIVGYNKINIVAVDKEFKESLKINLEEITTPSEDGISIVAVNGVTINPAYPPEIDFTFIAKKNKLQKLFNGDVECTLKRVSKKESQKPFPEN